MVKHIHRKFTKKEVIDVLEKYLSKEIEIKHALSLLDLGRSRFFDLLKQYRSNPDHFSIEYKRTKATRKIEEKSEKEILKALKQDKKIIEDKRTTVKKYNYSYIKEQLEKKHGVHVSLSTIIDRAKKMNFTN